MKKVKTRIMLCNLPVTTAKCLKLWWREWRGWRRIAKSHSHCLRYEWNEVVVDEEEVVDVVEVEVWEDERDVLAFESLCVHSPTR